MRDSRFIFKAEDIRRCFPFVSDTNIVKWFGKGIVDSEASRKAIRTSYKYSALQIVHVGLLGQLSSWGVLDYYRDAVVSCPAQGDYTLLEPSKMVESYFALGPDVIMLVRLDEMSIDRPDKRQRQTRTIPFIALMKIEAFREWKMTTGSEVHFIDQDNVKYSCSGQHFKYGYLFVDLGQMIHNVYHEFVITYLLG